MWAVCGLISLIWGWTECGGCVGVTCAFATSTAEARETGEAATEATDATDDDGDDYYRGNDYTDYYWPPAAGSVSVEA